MNTKQLKLNGNPFYPKVGIESFVEGTIDTTPTQNSNNLVTSGGVYSAIQGATPTPTPTPTVDTAMDSSSTNAVQNKVIKAYVDGAAADCMSTAIDAIHIVKVNGESYKTQGTGGYEADIKLKTINNESIIGEGNITIEGGGGTGDSVTWANVTNKPDYITNLPTTLNNYAQDIQSLENSVATKASVDDLNSKANLQDVANIVYGHYDENNQWVPGKQSDISVYVDNVYAKHIPNLNTIGDTILNLPTHVDDVLSDQIENGTGSLGEYISRYVPVSMSISGNTLYLDNTTGGHLSNVTIPGGGGVTNIEDLSNVTISSPASGQVLKYNGSGWVNGAVSGGGGATAIGDLDDVTLSSLTNGQILKYDAASSKWVNGIVSVDVPVATTAAIGGIKLGYQTSSGSKSYAVQVDSGGNAFVNVPWTDTVISDLNDLSNVTISSATTNQVLKFNGTSWVNGTVPSVDPGTVTWDDVEDKPSYIETLPDTLNGHAQDIQSLENQMGNKADVSDLANKANLQDLANIVYGHYDSNDTWVPGTQANIDSLIVNIKGKHIDNLNDALDVVQGINTTAKFNSKVDSAFNTLVGDYETAIGEYFDRYVQSKLVSGSNIKTVGGISLLGEGNVSAVRSVSVNGGTAVWPNDHGLLELTVPGGGTVDTAMSDSSTNAVQNKVIKGYIDGAAADVMSAATDAIHVVKVNGTSYKTLDIGGNTADIKLKTINNNSIVGEGNITIEGGGTVDSSLSTSSENAILNKAVATAINGLITDLGSFHNASGDDTLSYSILAINNTLSTKLSAPTIVSSLPNSTSAYSGKFVISTGGANRGMYYSDGTNWYSCVDGSSPS